MTDRKPQGLGWESWVDRLVREAEERGEFEDLPGQGAPIPGRGSTDDPDWWLKSFLEREGLSVLPESLRLALDVERRLERIARLPSETHVRREVRALNAEIVSRLPRITSGPPTAVGSIDVEKTVHAWRASRSQ